MQVDIVVLGSVRMNWEDKQKFILLQVNDFVEKHETYQNMGKMNSEDPNYQ